MKIEEKDVDKLNINLTISGKIYPFTLYIPEDEIYYRNAQKLINNKLDEYRNQFKGLFNIDTKDFLAFIAVDALLDAQKLHDSYTQLQQDVFEKLNRLEKEVSID